MFLCTNPFAYAHVANLHAKSTQSYQLWASIASYLLAGSMFYEYSCFFCSTVGPTMIGIDIYVISLSEVSEKTMVSACLTSFGNNFQTNIFCSTQSIINNKTEYLSNQVFL